MAARFTRLRALLPTRRPALVALTATVTAAGLYRVLGPQSEEERDAAAVMGDPSALYYGARHLRLEQTRPVGSESDRPSPTWTPPTRAEMLHSFKSAGKDEEREFDLLVVGGGATGSGIAVDAASRGLKVGLVERDDFSSGKLVHNPPSFSAETGKDYFYFFTRGTTSWA